MEHTPTPWQYPDRVKTIGRLMRYTVTDNENMPIAQFYSEEDAIKTVKCVNCHDELMAIAKACRNHFESIDIPLRSTLLPLLNQIINESED